MQYLIEIHTHYSAVQYKDEVPFGARKLCTVDGHTFWYIADASVRKHAVQRAKDAMTIALPDLNIPLTAAIQWHVGGGKKNPESSATKEAKRYTKPLL